ncbi:hypothetical protein AWB76_02222 [Caballeronia temeraria]|uniref:C2H2-type domain-containing protein n=1 Tax=Caballeronia temeraria TaxID=1777137 RepID=A0A158ADF0_9BURK|nr:hypothetical protein [Caballeronia temeraria]SAK55739.1 hypothetical protein AWB76_02222 [Caballeronia temeraria]
MSGRFSFRHRLVQCPRCRRQVGANLGVCPHCDFHRVRKPEPVRPLPAAAPEPVDIGRAPRASLRWALVIVLALLATFRPRA